MAEWRTPAGDYNRIMDLQDGTVHMRASRLGISSSTRIPGSLSRAPFPASLPKSLATIGRAIQSNVVGACDTCDPSDGGDPSATDSWDPYGDFLSSDSEGYDFTGADPASDPNSFDTSLLFDDFGTDELDLNMDGYTVAAGTSVKPMTNECKAAL